MNPLCVTATTDKLSDIGRRNIENLKRSASTTSRYTTNPVVRRTHQPARAAPGRRHLVARARDDLHRAGARRRPDRASRSSCGARTPQNEYGGPAAAADGQHAHAPLARGVRRPARPARVATSSARTASSRAHLIPYTYPSDERPRATSGSPASSSATTCRGTACRTRSSPRRTASRPGRTTIEGSLCQLREPRQPPDRHPRLLQVHQVRLRPRDRPSRRMHVRRGRLRRADAVELVQHARRPVPVDLPRQAARGDARRTST